MMDRALREIIIRDATRKLDELAIDVYLILTSEGSDPMTPFLPGVGTVGAGAFAFTKSGERYALSTRIDAQDIKESALFTKTVQYDSFERALADLLGELRPRVIAVNRSTDDPRCDGLTMGRLQWLRDAMPEGHEYELVSSDRFMPELLARYGAGEATP